MDIKEIDNILKELGWKPKRNVDRFADKDLADRSVSIIYRLKDFGTEQIFYAWPSLFTKEFTSMVKVIRGIPKDYNDVLLCDSNRESRFDEPQITRAHIEASCNDAIEWALSIDISKRYRELCDIDPSTPGAAGVWHLAALALLGKREKLLDYQRNFAEGNICGFVRYITKDFIDRALALAEKNAAAT